MRKTNKKGFTLVELLAVIVILGVLLLIAVPSITNVIDKSKKNAFESQVKLALENVETMLSVADDSNKPATLCQIPVGMINLDRGSWSGYTGYIEVKKDSSVAKGYTVKASISNADYSVSDKDLNSVAADTSRVVKTSPASNSCSAWYN